MNKVDLHFDICQELNKIYEQKNHDYGDSFHETWKEEGFAMARIRLSDKLNRFKKLSKIIELDNEDQMVKDESMQDTLLDLANYAIMTVMEMRIEKDSRTNKQPLYEKVDALLNGLPYVGTKSTEVRL